MKEHILSAWREIMAQGTQCLGEAQYPEAEQYFSQGVSLARDLPVAEILAFSLRLLATARVRLGKLDIAESGFCEALKICEDVKNGKGMAEALAGLASVATGRGCLTEAVLWYERSIAVYPPNSPRLRLGMLYFDLGQIYVAQENWLKAEQTYTSALDLCHRFGYPKGEGELSVLLGEVCYRQGDKRGAQVWLKNACRVFVRAADEFALANALQYLAFLDYDLDEYFSAKDNERRALALWLRLGRSEEVSEGSYFLSKIEQSTGAVAEAEYYLEMSIGAYDKQDIGIALRYQSLAGLALLRLDFSRAEKYYMEALGLFDSLGNEVRMGEVYEALGFVSEASGNEEKAVEFYQKAVEMLNGHGVAALNVLQRLGECYEKRRNYFRSLQCYWQALEIAQEAGTEVKSFEQLVQRVSKRLRQKH